MPPEMIRGVYDPTTGKCGCVLLQAAHKCDNRVSNIFGTEDWDLAPEPGQAIMEATLEQWRWLASLPREERVKRWEAMAHD